MTDSQRLAAAERCDELADHFRFQLGCDGLEALMRLCEAVLSGRRQPLR